MESVNQYNPTLSVELQDKICQVNDKQHSNIRIHTPVASQPIVSCRGRRKFRGPDGAVIGQTEAREWYYVSGLHK